MRCLAAHNAFVRVSLAGKGLASFESGIKYRSIGVRRFEPGHVCAARARRAHSRLGQECAARVCLVYPVCGRVAVSTRGALDAQAVRLGEQIERVSRRS